MNRRRAGLVGGLFALGALGYLGWVSLAKPTGGWALTGNAMAGALGEAVTFSRATATDCLLADAGTLLPDGGTMWADAGVPCVSDMGYLSRAGDLATGTNKLPDGGEAWCVGADYRPYAAFAGLPSEQGLLQIGLASSSTYMDGGLADITYVGAGTFYTTMTFGENHTVPGIATTQADDIVFMMSDNMDTVPAGWTGLAVVDTGAGQFHRLVYKRAAGATADQSIATEDPSTEGALISARMWAFRGAKATGSPFNVGTDGGFPLTAGPSIPFPALTTTVAKSVLVAFVIDFFYSRTLSATDGGVTTSVATNPLFIAYDATPPAGTGLQTVAHMLFSGTSSFFYQQVALEPGDTTVQVTTTVTTNIIQFSIDTTSGKPKLVVYDSTGATKQILADSAISAARHRLFGCSNSGTLTLWVDGVLVAGTSSGAGAGTVAIQQSTVYLGSLALADGGATNQAQGWLSNVVLIPQGTPQ